MFENRRRPVIFGLCSEVFGSCAEVYVNSRLAGHRRLLGLCSRQITSFFGGLIQFQLTCSTVITGDVQNGVTNPF